jgi:hypothetical protein
MSVVRGQRGSSSASGTRYNLGNFLRTLAMPETIKDWSLTTLKEKLIKIGAKFVSHGRALIPGYPENASDTCGIKASCDFHISVHTP